MRLNKVATNEHQSIPDEDKLLALNEAQIKLIKNKLSVNNIYNLGLDSFKKRYEDLQKIIVQNEKITGTKYKDAYDYYKFSVGSLSNKYMFPISLVAFCTKGTCKERPLVAQKIVKHADLAVLMANDNYVPSFEYQETLMLISADEIYTYTDGTFAIDYMYFTYIRYPQKIDIAGYIDLEGNPSVDSDCELDSYLENELLTLAEEELAMNTENVPAIQNTQIKLKNQE